MYIRFNSNSCKTLLIYLISFVLIYTPTLTFASAAEKWELVAQSYDRAKNTVNVEARKISQAAANSSRYKVEVPVNASTLGSSVKTMLWAGVAVGAITALIEGVGWIIDEGSKVIKKKNPDEGDKNGTATGPWVWQETSTYSSSKKRWTNAVDALTQICQSWGRDGLQVPGKVTYNNSQMSATSYCTGGSGSAAVYYVQNRDYSEGTDSGYSIVSDSELGDEVLGKGTEPNSSTSPNTDIINDAYNPNNPTTEGGAQTDTALDAAPPQPDSEPSGNSKPKPNVDTDGDGVPDTYDPDKPSVGEEFELPAFCSWAVTVCEWYTQYKQDAKEVEKHREEQEKPFFQKVKDWLDWTKEESPPDKDPEKPEIKDPDLSIGVTNYIQFGSQCPVDRQIPLSMGGQTLNLVISYQPLCTVAQQFRPAVILMAFLAGAFIITNTGRRAETGD